MDVLAHALWVGAGVTWAGRHRSISRTVVLASLAAAALPDLVQGLPVLLWAVVSGGGVSTIADFVLAGTDRETGLPTLVYTWSHHLHCVLHSAPIALAASLAVRVWAPALWPVIAAWWAHIVIDVLTHSAEFYPVPVLYPFTMAGFDGIAWNTPWFMAVNYGALVLAWAALWLSRRA